MRTWSCAILCLASPLTAAEFRVGAASAMITPPEGTPMAGYYHARSSSAVHDDLRAKVIALELDGERAVLVALDVITTTRGLVDRSRAEIEARTGIPAANVMLSATHAHTGPVIADGSPRSAALGGGKDLAVTYAESLPALIATAVEAACASLRPASVSAAIGREDSLAFCRRFWMRDGSVGWNPGKLNPDIVRPVGPTDPAVPVVSFDAIGGEAIATYVNFAMHLDTVGGTEISADYPHTVARALAEVRGPEALTVFTIGAAGDINHIDVARGGRQQGHREAARIGTVLAGEVVRCIPRLERIEPAALRCRSAIVRLPPPDLEPGAVEKAEATLARSDPKPTFLETVEAYKALDVARRQGAPLPAEVQAIALGNGLAWVGLPGEIFVELGLAIKEGSPFRTTIVAALANGSIGYVPTRRAWPEGNYEVASARVAKGSGEVLVETALVLLRELHAP